jgi:CheY-like chemotaxis protein
MTPGMHILVVDDEPYVGEVVTRLLQPCGHEVECCRSGVEALQKMQSARAEFDLLIADHHMPGTWSGLDLVSMIRRKGSRIPIFVISGRLTLEVIGDYRTLGIDALLPKPFEPSRLLKKIGELNGASPD